MRGPRKNLLIAAASGVVVVAVLIAVVVALVAVSGGGGSGAKALPSGDLQLQLKPNKNDALGVDTNAGFVLTSGVDLDASQVRSALKVTPDATITVNARSSREFRVSLAKAPPPNTLERFAMVSPQTGAILASWAYQTMAPLSVVSTLPDDQTNAAPMDTGIEITFSSDAVIDPQNAIQIAPQTPGRFEQHGRTEVFVPEALQPSMLYTVTVKAGLQVKGSDQTLKDPYVFQFETQDVRRSGPPPPSLSFLRNVNEVSTKDAPLITVQTTDQTLKAIDVSVYQYPDQKTFIADLGALDALPAWSYGAHDVHLDPTRLGRLMTINASVEDVRDPRSSGAYLVQPYIRFPTPLPAGNYLMQVTYSGKQLQAWLEVTDLASFVTIANGKSLVWVNDVSSGGPVSGAKVELAGASGSLGTTNDQGLAQFDTPAAAVTTTIPSSVYSVGATHTAKGDLVVTDAKGRSAVVPLSPTVTGSYFGVRQDSNYGTSADYWFFISKDRPIYKPGDTVHVWGVARARDGTPKRDLTLQLYSNNLGQGTAVGSPTPVQTDSLGAFQADLLLAGVGSGTFYEVLRDAGGIVGNDTVRIAQYVKPGYRITVTPSQTAVLAGDNLDVTVQAQFYDGTPVAGALLDYNGGKGATQKLTTDASGQAVVHVAAKLLNDPSNSSNINSGAYEVQTINVTPDRAEEGQITGSADIVVFPASVSMQVDGSVTAGKGTFSGDVSNIDLKTFSSGLGRGLYPYYGYGLNVKTKPAFWTTPVANLQLSAKLTQISYTQTEDGEQYDFVNKVTRKTYSYNRKETPLPNLSATTDAQGHFSFSIPADATSSYDITITAKDPQGRTIAVGTTAYSGAQSLSQSTFAEITYPDPQNGRSALAVGDKTQLKFSRGAGDMPSGGNNRYLFLEASRGLKRVNVQDNPLYTVNFSQDDVPSIEVDGVYFNGATYVEAVLTQTVNFDSSSKQLNVNVSTPQPSYGPGDEATVDVSVTDAAGKPVQAEVNLAAVDEAVFDVQDISSGAIDITSLLYRDVPPGIIRTYASHQLPLTNDGPGGKGGGGDLRSDFVDTAYFGTTHTDGSGKAQVKFKLPDNLTSWRLTAFALSGDLQAGHTTGAIAVTQPFFVDVTLNDDYLTSDKPTLIARAYGSALKDGDDVQLSVTSPGLGLSQPATASGKAFQAITLPLPPLKPGDFQLTIAASSGSQKDGILRNVTVVPSRLVAPVLDYHDTLKQGDALKGSPDGPTSVIFADAGRGRLLPALQALQYTYGDRLDQSVARVVSQQLQNQYFDQKLPVDDLPADLYQTYKNGTQSGLAVLPFAGSDLAATAQATALAPDVFGQDRQRTYFLTVLSDRTTTTERDAIALYGLASLGDPVLLETQSLQSATDLGWRGRLYVALALKASGDDDTARILAKNLVADFNEDQAPFQRLRVGTNQDDVLEATSLMAVLESGYDDAAANAYFGYLTKNAPKDRPDYLQQLLYIKAALERSGAGGVHFAYTVDGKRQTADLQNGKTLSLTLSPAQLAGLKVDGISGALSATTQYLAPLEPQQAKTTPDVTVKRSFSVLGKPANAPVTQDSLVEVDLDVTFGNQASSDCYQVTDLLPSGLKPVTKTSYLSAGGFGTPPKPGVIVPNLVDGQRVTFCIARGTTTRITYYARPSGLGAFTWEPAEINARSTPSQVALSAPASIEIR